MPALRAVRVGAGSEVVSAPDIAGIYAALARLDDRTPAQRRAYRVARSAQRGLRRRVVVPFKAGRVHHARYQRRDVLGRFC